VSWFEGFGRGNSESAEQRQEKWQRLRAEVDRIVDGLGRRIDEGIKPLVVALKANGFGTTGSCEGHPEDEYAYPWVDVESDLAERYYFTSRFKELADRRPRTPAEDQEFFRMRDLIKRANRKAYKQLRQVLGEYYAARADKATRPELEVELWGWNRSRLQPIGTPDAETQATLPNPISAKERIEKLAQFRKAVDDFSDFLTCRYFGREYRTLEN
jgi:hypothetical protein